MTQKLTEHSRQLRIKTANEHKKKLLASGKAVQISLTLQADIAEEFNKVVAELGLSRPQAIKKLCEIYRNQ